MTYVERLEVTSVTIEGFVIELGKLLRNSLDGHSASINSTDMIENNWLRRLQV
jgi:hypothetical protein